jgi:aryl-alcohol dehydrogenase-like predicted oxidoreductase
MKVALGTAQVGMDYGLSNVGGKMQENIVKDILQIAMEDDIKIIDTACSYGDSEETLGRHLPRGSQFQLVTKTPIFLKAHIDNSDAEFLEKLFLNSLLKLNTQSVYGLLIHRCDDLFVPGGHLLMERLVRLKKNGYIKKIGASVYQPSQVEKLINYFDIDLVQVPLNVLDQRFLTEGFLTRIKSNGIEIHARSAFLQGLLLMNPHELPDGFELIRPTLIEYHELIANLGLSCVDAAIGFIKSVPEIDCVVCGVNSVEHLREIIRAYRSPVVVQGFSKFAVTNEAIINPSMWGDRAK